MIRNIQKVVCRKLGLNNIHVQAHPFHTADTFNPVARKRLSNALFLRSALTV
jgi:hypothetical protein